MFLKAQTEILIVRGWNSLYNAFCGFIIHIFVSAVWKLFSGLEASSVILNIGNMYNISHYEVAEC